MRKHRFEVAPCVAREGGVAEHRECREGWFTFDRESLDTMLTIAQSERDCRAGEARRLEEPGGWDPVAVVLVAAGIAALVAAASFGAGYAVGSR